MHKNTLVNISKESLTYTREQVISAKFLPTIFWKKKLAKTSISPWPIQLPMLRAGMVLEYTSFSCVILLHRIKCSGAVLKLSG